MYLLLQDLEKSGNEDKIKILQSLGHILSSSSEMKDEFHRLGGVPIILKYLDKDDWKMAENAFHILGFSIMQNVRWSMLNNNTNLINTIFY
jgi:dihydroxyacid dehydratase/phosphogluconate dehydratase